jgi:hypothetical protein
MPHHDQSEAQIFYEVIQTLILVIQKFTHPPAHKYEYKYDVGHMNTGEGTPQS